MLFETINNVKYTQHNNQCANFLKQKYFSKERRVKRIDNI